MSSPPNRKEEGAGERLGHVASPPRRHEQHSTNNPSYHPQEHPQVLREYAPKYDEEQETQSPEGTHQSGVFVAEGHAGAPAAGGHPTTTNTTTTEQASSVGGHGDVQGQEGQAAER